MPARDEWKAAFAPGWHLAVSKGDIARTRFIEAFVREHPEQELRIKVFFELEHRQANDAPEGDWGDFPRDLLKLAQAQDAAGFRSSEDRAEWVHCLLRLGMVLARLDAGDARYGWPVPKERARQAVRAFLLAEPHLGDIDRPSLAQFQLFLARALLGAGEMTASGQRAVRAIEHLDAALAQQDDRIGKSERLRLQAMRAEAGMLANHR